MDYFAPMKTKALKFFAGGGLLAASSLVAAQVCPDGQSPVEMVVYTDNWGYEVYWEMTPAETPCGTNTLAWGGNAIGVGCSGDGDPEAPAGEYASNATFVIDSLCATPGEVVTLHYVDSYGDGGTYFEIRLDGVIHHAFQGTGGGNSWEFDPFESAFPVYDSPCGALPIEVDGEVVVLSNDSCSASLGEPGPPDFPGVYACQIAGGWCEGGVGASAWLSFEATSGNCRISSCTDSTDFDTQLALWAVEDCGDFESYTLMGANDDIPGGCGPGNVYSSALWTGCLDSGVTYLIQLDGWYGSRGTAGIFIESVDTEEVITSATGGLSCALGKEEDPNGTIVLNPVGMGSGFTAAWVGPNGFSGEGQQISGLTAGTYSAVVVSNCGGSLVHTVTLTEPAPISTNLEVVPPLCPELADGSASLAVEGGTEPYTVTWFGEAGELGTGAVIEGLAEGEYTLTMEDGNGCQEDQSFSIEANDDAFAFSLGPDTTFCEDEQVILSGPVGLEYLWSTGSIDQFIIVNGSEWGPGTYPIVLEASNEFGCSHSDAIFLTIFDCTTGIGDLFGGSAGLAAFPNPVAGQGAWNLTWEAPSQRWDGEWELIDLAGRTVQQGRNPLNAGAWTLALPTDGLAPGQYFWLAKGTPVSLRLQLN